MKTASPESIFDGMRPTFFLEIDLHDREEALLVRLLVNLDLDVAVLHLLDDLRRKIKPAQQDLAWGMPRSFSMRATFECQSPISI